MCAPTKAPKNRISEEKIFISEVNFRISEVKKPLFWQKKRREPFVYGLSPLRCYKDNTFSREMQIALTFEYKSEMLKCSDLQQTGSNLYYITRLDWRLALVEDF